MLRALSYHSNPQISVTEYRSLKRDQDELGAMYGSEDEAKMIATLLSFSRKLLLRTLLVFTFFIGAFFLQQYNIW